MQSEESLMLKSKRFAVILSAAIFIVMPVIAQRSDNAREITVTKGYAAPVIRQSARLQTILDSAVNESLTAFRDKGFKPGDAAATLIDLTPSDRYDIASVRGEAQIYPASVVKLFYLAAIERQIDEEKVRVTPELERGIHDMIVNSSNEATQYILDVITDTSSGAEMPDKDFAVWQYKRNRVNRYFTALGYTNINVNQKTFCEDAYGIEQQSRGYKGNNRNMLTTNAVARLLAEIVKGRMGSNAATSQMMNLLQREPFAAGPDDDQAHGFTGRMLIDQKMTDAKLWSKAGWTNKARHDAAYIETSDGLKFVLVIFTEDHASENGFIPMVAAKVINGLKADVTEHRQPR